MSTYFLAPASKQLWEEIRESGKFPGRESESDGWIGDASHQARISDHNPCWSCTGASYGIVRATDFDTGGWDAQGFIRYLLERCRSGEERRVQYVINERRIWSASWDWDQHDYDGENPHNGHVHISLKHDASNFDAHQWLPTFPAAPEPTPEPPKETTDMATEIRVHAPDPAKTSDVQFLNVEGCKRLAVSCGGGSVTCELWTQDVKGGKNKPDAWRGAYTGDNLITFADGYDGGSALGALDEADIRSVRVTRVSGAGELHLRAY